ncbi:MAG: M50 family metallopeptidase [Candidatus Promineifilaceae bacterium]
MNSEDIITLLFNIISIFYAFRGLQIAATIVRNWGSLKKPGFTPQSKSLASQASFFVAVPVGVFFHELSHALAVWLFGGQVLEFNYRVFWGSVLPGGNFTAAQDWFIALAGTLGSLVFGLVCWLALKNNNSPTFRYFGLRAFRFQIFFSLIYYPVFTLLGFYGDWRTIYDFTATPLLSGETAILHAGMLLWFWRTDRSGFFEMGAFGSPETKSKVTALEARVAANPYDPALQLQLIDVYRQGGMANKAKQLTQKFIKENPRSGEGYLQMALLEEAGKREVPAKAKAYAAQALSLGLGNPEVTASAYQVLGRYNLTVNKPQEAIEQLSQALGALKATTNQGLLISVLYYRAQAYRRKEQYDAAYQDIQRAIQLTENGNQEAALTFLNRELETIYNHSGRSASQFSNSTNQS